MKKFPLPFQKGPIEVPRCDKLAPYDERVRQAIEERDMRRKNQTMEMRDNFVSYPSNPEP